MTKKPESDAADTPKPTPKKNRSAKAGAAGLSSNGLMAVGTAAVLTVYAAGYARTEEAAKRIAEAESERSAARPAYRAGGSPSSAQTGASGTAASAAPSDAAAASALEGLAATNGEGAGSGTAQNGVAASSTSSTAATAGASTVKPTGSTGAVVTTAGASGSPGQPSSAPPAADSAVAPPAPTWKDGTYYRLGTSRHGDIQARVIITAGKITSADIWDCRTRYSCSIIDRLIPQVVERQSPDVDTVSGATQSADAWYFAVREALTKALGR